MAINLIETSGKKWVCKGSDDAIRGEALPPEKTAFVRMHLSAKRNLFLGGTGGRKQHMVVSKDAMDETHSWRAQPASALNASGKDPYLLRDEIDMGVQAVRPTVTLGAQTPYYRRVNMAIQAQPAQVDAHFQSGKDEAMEPGMKKFFHKVLPRVMHHITQNAVLPIFGDDFLALTEDDTFVGSREENYLKEAGNYFHHYTRDKQIMSIDWRPNKSAIVVSVMKIASLEERLVNSCSVEPAVCLVWSFTEQTNPQFILEAPAEVVTVKFCPGRQDIVVGGLINGQVVAWNLAGTDSKARGGKGAQKVRQQHNTSEDVYKIPEFEKPVAGQSLEKSGDHMVWRLKPFQLSRIEYSHRRSVQDICWLPADSECHHDGKLIEPKDQVQNQFATIGEDGVMYLWDMRPDNQPEQKLKRLKGTNIKGDALNPWVPLLKWNLAKDNGELLMGLRFSIECRHPVTREPLYLMTCTTIEGEFATCYWGPKDDKPAAQAGFDDPHRRETKMVREICDAHAGPAWSVQRHPLLPDYYLTVGDWGFKIWQLGLSAPILASPLSDQQVMCGRWSPTRPAVLFIGTGDGYVQVWDLLDRSHEKLFGHIVVPEAITVLEFKPASERRGGQNTQHLAVGTRAGNFQLYELPKKLVKAHPQETRLTDQFFKREARRVAYFTWRWKERKNELEQKRQDGTAGDARGKGDEGGDDEHNDYNVNSEDDEEFKKEVAELDGADGTSAE
jgi:WD40 repeat protein